jgi:hypothetical protein
LARGRSKQEHIYYSAILKYLENNQAPIGQQTFRKLRKNIGVEHTNNYLSSLKYFNPYLHTPVEILHTVLLGFGKYLMFELKKEIDVLLLEDTNAFSWIGAWIDIVDISDCNSTITTSQILEKRLNFVG